MSEITRVDATGLSCPQPVLLTKRALAQASGDEVEVLVDTATSRDNCARIAIKAGWKVTSQDAAITGFRLVLHR